ncbi:MAG: MG2 domain-containing protein [Crocinitomicaceae bacterium]|nr:MG2 domain-containing protein [Crocinitomicaceae bacterium]
MKRFIFQFGILILSFFLLSGGCDDKKVEQSNGASNATNKTQQQNAVEFTNYEQGWKTVDSLDNKNLPKSALAVVNTIMERATAENNQPMQIKALMYQLKFSQYLEEDFLNFTLNKIEDLKKSSEQPLKQILTSIKGEMIWNYYQNNRYAFYDRTTTQDFELGDIATWDLKTLANEVYRLYVESLENKALLQKTSIEDFSYVLTNKSKEAVNYCPTVFDFLAHRALTIFENDELSITRPVEQFTINYDNYFGSDTDFLAISTNTEDSLSMHLHYIKVMQELVRFHQQHHYPIAELRNRLERYRFAYQKTTNDNKTNWYKNALLQTQKDFTSNPATSEINAELAKLYQTLGNEAERGSENYGLLKTAHQLCKETIDKYPETVGSSQCLNTLKSIEEKTLGGTVEAYNSSNSPILAQLNFKNISSVYVNVYETKEKERYYSDLKAEIQKLKLVSSKKVDLPKADDFHPHITEISLEPLEYGNYVVLYTTNPDKLDSDDEYHWTSSFQVTDIAISVRDLGNNTHGLQISDRNTGVGMENKTVNIYQQTYNYTIRKYENKLLKRMTSGANGWLIIPQFNSDYGKLVEVINGKDVLASYNNLYTYNGYKNKESYSDNLFTDRAIYRPGQTVYFKGIRLVTQKRNSKIVVNDKVTILFKDANYQEVNKLELTSNEYGSYSGSFKIPNTGLTGSMYLETTYGSVSFKVEEYKRPTFKVEFDKSTDEYKLGESVQIKGTAAAYAGNAVDNATVKYVVSRKSYLPYWRVYYYRMLPYNSAETIIKQGAASTDEKGKFQIDFKADKDPSNRTGLNYTYTVSVDVTDANGETRSASKYVYINEEALQLRVSVQESLDKSKTNQLNVATTNNDGVDIPAKGTIVISELKPISSLARKRGWSEPDMPLMAENEFKSKFPHFSYQSASKIDLEIKKVVATLNFDTEKSKEINLNTQSWNTGEYKIETTTKDKFGNEVKDVQFIQLTDASSNQVPIPTVLHAYALKNVYEPGETIALPIASSLTNQQVLVEVFCNSEIIQQQHLYLSNEQKTIHFKVEEKHRGGISIHLTAVRYGQVFTKGFSFTIPYSNKELSVSFETFRDKLQPGEKEEWRLRIRGPKKDKVAAEMLLAMYDQSLDAFVPHAFMFQPFQQNNYVPNRHHSGFGNAYGRAYYNYYNYTSSILVSPPNLNYFGFNFYDSREYYYFYSTPVTMKASRASETSDGKISKKEATGKGSGMGAGGLEEETKSMEFDMDAAAPPSDHAQQELSTENTTEIPSLRTNFNETAFFYPHLKTDNNGDILVSFTVPESLTSWKVIGLAHTKDLQYALVRKEVVTQKELMVQTNLPRFVRTSDEVVLTAKISNLTEKLQKGEAKIQLFDALTMEDVSSQFKLATTTNQFNVEAKQSTVVSWKVNVPTDFIGSLTIRITAKSDNHSDGEELALPVLTDKVLVTESMPMTNNGIGSKTFTFDKLLNNNSSTLQHHSVTMEYSSNPAWYVIQALPYMLEYPYECSEQIFTRFYANSIASNIVRSTPKIKDVFEKWKSSSPDAFLSNLEKNQELKAVLLQETPWVLDANNETERKKRIALLFDFNKMDNELALNLQKLQKAQVSNGGFPWFPGMKESRYITQYIVSGMGHLNELGISSIKNNDVQRMIEKAVNYLDNRIVEDYNYWKQLQEKNKNYQFEPTNLQYLYARSFFTSIKLSKTAQEAFDFFRTNTEKNWQNYDLNSQAMLALATYRLGNSNLANDIVKSIVERSITTEEMGMYWKENERGYYWYQAPIETQALIIEALTVITKDQKAINNAKIWLLRNKQTSDWKTTTATANAAYALLLGGNSFAEQPENVKIEINGVEIKPEDFGTQAEAGTGYFKATWTGSEISNQLGNVNVTRKDDGFSWGAMYWQYFESMEKVTSATTNLKLNKQLFLVKQTNAGEVILPIKDNVQVKRGDKVRVRIELSTDRNLEYVHMKDYRSAGFEPVNVLSSYKWQGRLGYYESTKDVATHFFFDYLPKGTYVFEYDLKVFHSGDFTNGFAEIECMYAPEFKSHSNGVRVRVD